MIETIPDPPFHLSHLTMASARRSCPCQHITLSLSSSTAAEYGDIPALSRRLHQKRSNESHQSTSLSNGGITPLHLAAQHDHPAAVSLLLSEGRCNIDTGLTNDASPSLFCGATPLHRAAFSGAISSMRILLDRGRDNPLEQTDILAKDESFGDMRTPLHKSVAGGRPLAVQLLLMALRERNLLLGGLAAVDSQGLTPLGLVKQFTSLNEEDLEREKSSVRRWDGIAGGCADWERCQQLLEGAVTCTEQGHLMEHNEMPKMPQLNSFTKDQATFLCDSVDGCQDRTCRTAVWENAFRVALASSMESSLHVTDNSDSQATKTGNTVQLENETHDIKCSYKELNQDSSLKGERMVASLESLPTNNEAKPKKFGRACDICQDHSSALFRSATGLVCSWCRRSMRT